MKLHILVPFFSDHDLCDQHGALQMSSSLGASAAQPQMAYQQLTASDLTTAPGIDLSSLTYSPNTVTKPNNGSEMLTVGSSTFSQKVAFLPVGSSGTKFFPVRMDHMVANLPLVAKKLATVGNFCNPQGQTVVATTEKDYSPTKSNVKVVTLMANNQQQSDLEAYVNFDKGAGSIGQSSGQEQGSTDSLNYYPVMSVAAHSSVSQLQPAASPVYKSKLEKAMAQSMLKQNAAKENVQPVNKRSLSMDDSRRPIPMSGHEVSEKMETTSLSSISSQSRIQNVPISGIMSKSSQAAMPVKHEGEDGLELTATRLEQDSMSVTKVAERYKDMVSRQSVPHQYIVKQSESPQFETHEPVYVNINNAACAPKVQDPNYPSYSQLANPQVSFAYFHPASSFPSSEMRNHSALVTEKVYSDTSITRDILKYLWELRESEKYCDAVIYSSDGMVKVSIQTSHLMSTFRIIRV